MLKTLYIILILIFGGQFVANILAVSDKAIRHVEIGNVHYEKGRYEWALREYKKAIKIDENFVWAYFNAAKACENIDNLDQAIIFYKKAAKVGE